tara:strand:- start:14284 stop:15156 length:873 start_codon:yes stop_codon:yes gene_type:complete
MKPETFQASIEKGSNKLYLQSNREAATRNGAFIKLDSNDIFYRIESSESINIRRKFTFDGDHSIKIKGNYDFKLSTGDSAKITFDELEAVHVGKLIDQQGKYKVGQKIYLQGGITSSFSGNITGEYGEVEVLKVDEAGKILSVELTKPGLYIKPPENPVDIMDETGQTLKAEVEFDSSSHSSIIERDFTSVENSGSETLIRLSYDLPKGVLFGEMTVSKQVILLDKPYSSESFENGICQITFDYSPVNGIPLLPPNSIDPQTTYNEAVLIIENKLQNMEKRIVRMENMNY